MTDLPPDEGLEGLGDESFDGFGGGKKGLGALWRDSAAFKIGAVVGAAVLIFGAITLFGGSATVAPDPSYVPEGSNISAPPGTEEANPAYIDAIKEQNEANTEQAIKEGGSVLPTPIEPPVGVLSVPDENKGTEDPLQRWRKLQEERLEKEILRTQTLAPAAALNPEDLAQQDANREAAIQAMSQAMMTQMQSILQTKNQVRVSQKQMTDPSWLETLKQKEEKEIAEAQEKEKVPEEVIENILIPAGQIHYAQMINEANSDVPGPVLAQVLSGPLSGSRLIGEFAEEDEQFLSITFSRAVLKGITYNIDAIALDPATTLPGMATDIDRHYFKRIVLPAAASFIEGMATAISETGRTTVTIDGGAAVSETEDASNEQEVSAGVDEMGTKLGEIIDEIAEEEEVTIIVARGTPLAVLFLEPVIESESTQAQVGTTNDAIAKSKAEENAAYFLNAPQNAINGFGSTSQ